MAWEERTVEQMREEFARRALAQERPKAVCAESTESAVPPATSG